MSVAIKRAYEAPSRQDGARVLVDRLWPRGLSKASAKIDEWLRDIAPTDELRRWYHDRPGEWQAFRKKYLKELAQPECEEALRELYQLAQRRKRLTLLFASRLAISSKESARFVPVLNCCIRSSRRNPTESS